MSAQELLYAARSSSSIGKITRAHKEAEPSIFFDGVFHAKETHHAADNDVENCDEERRQDDAGNRAKDGDQREKKES